jgi:hypothetical protein
MKKTLFWALCSFISTTSCGGNSAPANEQGEGNSNSSPASGRCAALPDVPNALSGEITQSVKVRTLTDAARIKNVTTINGRMEIAATEAEPENNVLDCLELPNLTAIRGEIHYLQSTFDGKTATQGPKTLSFPRLEKTAGIRLDGDADSERKHPLQEVFFDALKSVEKLEGEQATFYSADFTVFRASNLVRLEAPLLENIDGKLLVMDNPELSTLNLSAVKTIGNSRSCEIEKNPKLCNSVGEAVRTAVNEDAFFFDVEDNKECTE